MQQKSLQYTIRNVPSAVDRALRHRAKKADKSFNQVVLEALAAGAGESLVPRRDLRHVIGSMSPKEADAVDEQIRLQRQIDPELWR